MGLYKGVMCWDLEIWCFLSGWYFFKVKIKIRFWSRSNFLKFRRYLQNKGGCIFKRSRSLFQDYDLRFDQSLSTINFTFDSDFCFLFSHGDFFLAPHFTQSSYTPLQKTSQEKSRSTYFLQKTLKSPKCKGVGPILRDWVIFVMIVRRACGCFWRIEVDNS